MPVSAVTSQAGHLREYKVLVKQGHIEPNLMSRSLGWATSQSLLAVLRYLGQDSKRLDWRSGNKIRDFLFHVHFFSLNDIFMIVTIQSNVP